MSDALQLILEDSDGTQLETSCTRFAVVWQGKEVWIQAVGDQLLIGVDVEEGDTEYANLLLRPQATNLVGLQLEMEPADLAGRKALPGEPVQVVARQVGDQAPFVLAEGHAAGHQQHEVFRLHAQCPLRHSG